MTTQAWLQSDIYRWASWWLSDDLFVWIKDSFYSSRNINIRNSGKAISLSNAFVKEYTPDQPINVIIKIKQGDIVAFGNNGGIFRKNNGTRSKVTTATPAKAILSANEFNWYIYWAQDNQLHRVKSSDWWGNLTGNETIGFQWLNTSNYHPLIVSMGSMFVGNGDSFDEVDIDDLYMTLTTIETGGEIQHFTDLWGMIRATVKSEIWHYNIYLVQKWDKFAEQSIPLLWAGIKNTITFEWYTYITTEWWLTALDWYKLFKLKDNEDFNTRQDAIAIHKDKLLIWGKWVIYTRGKKNKNYPDVMVAERVTSNDNVNDEIRSIFSTGEDLYIWWNNWTDYGIDKLSSSNYWTAWELVTRAYYGNNLHEVKEWVEVWFGFQSLVNTEKIELQYSMDWWAFKSIVTLQSGDDRKVAFTDHIRIIDQFQYIQFKIKLSWSWSTTPTFYSMDFRFDIINK